jgi:hypothetical protein
MLAQSVQATKRGRPLKTEHAWPRWLAAQGSSVDEWCEKHGVSRNTAKGWYTNRKIPRKFADLIASESIDAATKKPALPATKRTWPNGIL